jgi:hypothetical protein
MPRVLQFPPSDSRNNVNPKREIDAMDYPVITETSAQDYVKALFRLVLNRQSTTDDEVTYWTREMLHGRSAAQLLELFVTCEENQIRLRANAEHPTRYPNGHFYSPVVDVAEVTANQARIFGRGQPLGIDLGIERQLALLGELAGPIGEIPFSDDFHAPYRYYYNNSSYAFGDAVIYWGMIAHFKPARIIEIGSGFTSGLALDAIDHYRLPTICTFIDPYPDLLLKVATPIDRRHTVLAEKVQDVDPVIVEKLERNDILFVDSSHVVKTDSDVHFEIMELLPRLKPGVIVHFHDIFYPFEYPRDWVIDENYSWNELYFLQAFLMFNDSFEVIYFNHQVGKSHADQMLLRLPHETASRIEINPGGGLWLRRV